MSISNTIDHFPISFVFFAQRWSFSSSPDYMPDRNPCEDRPQEFRESLRSRETTHGHKLSSREDGRSLRFPLLETRWVDFSYAYDQRDSIARENLRNTVSGTVTYGYSAKKCTSPHLPDSMNFFRDALCSLFFGSNVSRRTCGLLRNRELKFSETCTNSGIVVLCESYCRSIDAPVEFIQSDSLFKPGELPVRSIPSVGVNHNNVDAFRPFFAGLTRRIRIDDSQYHSWFWFELGRSKYHRGC